MSLWLMKKLASFFFRKSKKKKNICDIIFVYYEKTISFVFFPFRITGFPRY